MRRSLMILLALAIAAAGLWWYLSFRSHAAPIPFAKVLRETLISTLETNGKVEPSQWVDVHAERAASVQEIYVKPGQTVAKGAALMRLESSEARADLAAAEARIQQVRSELEVMAEGGRASDLADIENSAIKSQLDLKIAENDLNTVKRLQKRGAATAQEVTDAQNRVEQVQAQIRALQRRKASLVSGPDRKAAAARLRDAQSAAQLARERLSMANIRAPIAGTVYNLPVHTGAWVASGGILASIGQIDRVRVTLFVDEPELGRVSDGMPVTITWDALPGQNWTGTVDRTPTQVISLGTRQVGEVLCLIDNPGHDLLPGTNVNARIRSRIVENALTIPKEALRRQGGASGVFLLQGNRIVWRAVTTGISSVTRVQITSGLAPGDSVALATDQSLANGMEVQASYP
ncbi:MAG: efflux RND transporter periplasmic adaptor subunit [Bryobacterales bacterium]|nr:efflux RND transporter periplasmic adaptor subunit [Bryobacterales bacterium]